MYLLLKKSLLVIIVFANFLLLFGNCKYPKQDESSLKSADSQQEREGRKLYRKYCVNCHGPKGDLGMNEAANLTTSKLSKPEVVRIITEGRGMMTPFESILSKEEIESIADYALLLRE